MAFTKYFCCNDAGADDIISVLCKHVILRFETIFGSEKRVWFLEARGPFLECPGNFSGPKLNIQIEI